MREHQLGLDKPVVQRYVTWLGKAVHGDFGKTIKNKPVWAEVRRSMGVTLRLVLFASIVSILVGVLIGVISAVKQYSWFDHGATTGAFLLYSLPVLAVGSFLKYVLAIRFNRWIGRADDPLIKTIGEGTANFCTKSKPYNCGFIPSVTDFLSHAFLPMLTLVLISFAGYARFSRAAMLETLNADYVRTARAKGLSENCIMFTHVLRNAVVPLVRSIPASILFALLGTFYIEKIYAIPGLGGLLITANNANDYFALQGIVVISALISIISYLLGDITTALVDPRISFASK
ncbi:MAG: ABC transporter permease [Firmicutes bacterium]|nr:ABC transporter permease [Bacillota bacterium]